MEQMSLTPVATDRISNDRICSDSPCTPMPFEHNADRDSSQAAGNVTEIILPRGQIEHFQLLLPMLTQLNKEERWLAWIDPPAALVQQWQQHQGIIQGQLLVLRSSAQYSALELAQRALEAGTCHAVILWTTGLNRQSFMHLEQASAQGDSHGIVLRQR